MGRATDALAERAGSGVGGLLNATFGNAAELIIAAIGLSHGLGEVVKASITGSIIGNCLLVLGACILAGGLKHPVQRFNRTAASLGTTLMALAAIGLLVPTLFWTAAKQEGTPESGERTSTVPLASPAPEGAVSEGNSGDSERGAGASDRRLVPEHHEKRPVGTEHLEVLERGLSREIAFVLG